MLKVVTRQERGLLQVKIQGILDYATIGNFNESLPDLAGIEKIDIDFADLEFTDSTGIGAVLELIYAASESGAKVEFHGMRELVKVIFETVGVFDILRTLQEGG